MRRIMRWLRSPTAASQAGPSQPPASALRESMDSLRIVIETISDAVITIDEESRILYVNQAAERIFGHTIEQMIGQNLTMLMPEYLRHLHRAAIQRYLDTGHKHISWEAVELPGLHRSGQEIALELAFGEIVRDGRRFFTGVARDITERKRDEQRRGAQYAVTRALAESANLSEAARGILQRICEHLGWEMGVFWMIDRRAGVLQCVEIWQLPLATATEFAALTRDKTFTQGVGLPGRVWASGASIWIADIAEDKNFSRQAAALKEGLRSAFGFPILLGSEVLGVMEFFSRQIQSPDDALLEMMNATGNQIGQFIERKRAEAEVEVSEERYRYLADALPQIVWTARPDGYLDYYNQRWFEYTGLTMEQTKGWGWQPVLHPEDVERALRRWAKSVGTGESYQIEYRFKQASDGQYRWHLGRAVPLRDAEGHIVKWFGTCTDIDDQKRAVQAARESNRAKDNFLATLSHELRTPLTPIIGWLHMLRAGMVPPGESEYGLEIIDKNSHSLMRLINDLLDMSAIMNGKMLVESLPVSLHTVLREAVETTRPEADKRWIKIQLIDCDEAEVTVIGDQMRLVQVFCNLLNNAVKFSPDDSIVRVRCAADGDDQRIVVEDEGQGIRPDFLPHVFEQFRQADESKSRAHGGLGIGLALVKSFVTAHGGRVIAESPGVNQGSRLTVYLPRAAEPVAAGAADTTAMADTATTSETIALYAESPHLLIVDDAADTLALLQTALGVRGYRTMPCASAAEALRIAATTKFDLLISDIGLPQMDGHELLRRLRQLSHLRAVPAIALTGYAAPQDAVAVLEAGFDGHLTKPIDLSELVAAIESLLQRNGAEN